MDAWALNSQLPDQFLLEDRTELSFKYGFFEDTEWTIIGQITSNKSPASPIFNEVLQQTQNESRKYSKTLRT